MKSIRTSIVFFAVLLFTAACKKDHENSAPSDKAILSVKLNNTYLGAAQVDSAFAIWKTNASEQQIKMHISNDSLIADMGAFNEGSGQLTLQIFSNKKYENQYYAQSVSRKTISLQQTQSVSLRGPASFFDTSWFPRIELADAIGHKAVMALRPDDAYFLVKDPGHAVTKLAVERAYWNLVGGIQLVGVAVWECYTGCIDIPNDEYFKVLPSRIGDRQWNHISLTVVFEIDPVGGGYILSLEYEP
jgi:hypothetical protein